MLHLAQLLASNKFERYDYGMMENLRRYGRTSAPEYDLTAITHKNIHVIYAPNDWLVPMKGGISMLRSDLKLVRDFYEISNSKANHLDSLLGTDVAVEVNRKVLEILNIRE